MTAMVAAICELPRHYQLSSTCLFFLDFLPPEDEAEAEASPADCVAAKAASHALCTKKNLVRIFLTDRG